MYLVIGMGVFDEFEEEFETKEEAIKYLNECVKDFGEDCEDWNIDNYDDESFTACEPGRYQTFFIKKSPETMKEEILLEIDKAYADLEWYAWTLEDSGSCECHLYLYNIEKLVREIKC